MEGAGLGDPGCRRHRGRRDVVGRVISTSIGIISPSSRPLTLDPKQGFGV